MDRKHFNTGSNNQHSEFVELLTGNYYKIHCFILTLVPNKSDAEDVLQSAITYMWEHFGDFKRGTNFVSWSLTISKFQVLTHRKTQKRSRIYFTEKAVELIEAENEKLSEQMDVRFNALDQCIQKLPDKDCLFLKKRFEKEMSIKSLACEFGISVNAAYKRLACIKNLLLNCIRRTLAAGEVS